MEGISFDKKKAKVIGSGKTKRLLYDEESGKYYLQFTNQVTGDEEGINPGANQVLGDIEGMGDLSLITSSYFFERLGAREIKTHFLGRNHENGLMEIKKASPILLEFVGRWEAAGSVCKVFRIKQGTIFEKLATETMLKDDECQDPRIGQSMSVTMGLISDEEYEHCLHLLRLIGDILREELRPFGLELVDFKLEFGHDRDGKIILIDEISGGIWRVKKDGIIISGEESMKIIVAALTKRGL